MLNVNYRYIVGSKSVRFTDGTMRELNLFESNGLYACVHFWKTENGSKYESLVDFAIDKSHMENCLGLKKGYDNIFEDGTYFKLNLAYKPNQELANILLKAIKKGTDIKLECFYEPLKELNDDELEQMKWKTEK